MPFQVVANNVVVKGMEVFDSAIPAALYSGVTSPAGVTLTLQRQSGSTMVAASETVTWTEIGSTGRYYFSFTPTQTGAYVLYVHLIDAGSNGAFSQWDFDVVSAGAVFSPTYSEAFCAESDIERWTQTAISATSQPDDTEAAAFAEARAAILMSLCARLGYPVTPSTVTAGSRLEDLLREANAIGAALDYTIAQQFRVRPSSSDRPEFLQNLWTYYVGGAQAGFVTESVGVIEKEIVGNLASLSTDHILSGDTNAPLSSTTPTDSGVGPISMGSEF